MICPFHDGHWRRPPLCVGVLSSHLHNVSRVPITIIIITIITITIITITIIVVVITVMVLEELDVAGLIVNVLFRARLVSGTSRALNFIFC